ncbi:hypothetical protein GPJ56_007525 [Histomonas meleagridis]|uniref:uncharacterized protein n=1 Tax=Histomonas meleagridis TaxID=135588 RepID=UPI003559D253|nr:hypothetical protein GPJ56_007525 [Histomonas meleagridis]KAH0801162.1 hypothetical protein GO595_006197 [Histomonas meleagridis]
MEKLLRRVEEIGKATGNKDTPESQGKNNKKVDKFTLKKREINLQIRELRNDIAERDRYANARGTKDDKPEIVRQSTLIRTKLQNVKEEAKAIRDMVIKEEAKYSKKGKECPNIENRYKMCDLIDAHIEECERWFKGLSFVSQKNDPMKAALLKGANFSANLNPELVTFVPQDPTQTELEEIDGIDEWQLQINENEQAIDEKIDQVLEGTEFLKHLAQTMHDEYQVLTVMTDDVDKQMDKTQENLDDANKRLEHTKDALGTKAGCCMDVFLVILLICCVGFILWKYVF